MITIRISIFILSSIFCTVHGSFSDFFHSDYWSPENMVIRAGYPVETHNITTEDGYILTAHRIPGGEEAQPILLMHGLLCNSALWLVSGKEHSLAYVLADHGYDVWLGNIRGNKYGLNHINLTVNHAEFWDFSYHEMAIHDLPAIIKYILASTNQYPSYIGHSQGTTLFFLLAMFRPDIAHSLKLPVSLAPVAYVGHSVKPSLRPVVSFGVVLFKILQSLINVQSVFTPNWWLPIYFIRLFCAVLSIGNYNCLNTVDGILGYERPELFNQDILPAVVNHFPDGTSLKNCYFYAQHLMSDGFEQYDYGEGKNLELYNSSTPPQYDLKKVTQPNVIFVADSDIFVPFPDLNKILQLVPNIIDQFAVNASGFTHLDFMWGVNAKSLIYNQISELVNQ